MDTWRRESLRPCGLGRRCIIHCEWISVWKGDYLDLESVKDVPPLLFPRINFLGDPVDPVNLFDIDMQHAPLQVQH